MSEFQTCRLDDLMTQGSVQLGRGDVISKDDIAAHPGPYPIYSSSAHNNGKFGEYGKYMFDEELITWSVDGGGNFFYRDKHQFSVTNVCGFMRVNEKQLHHKFVYYSLAHQHRSLTFDYTDKAHPSVIKKQYRIPSIGKPVQEKIASILTSIDTAIEKTEALIAKHQQIKAGLMHDLFTRGVLPNGQLRPPRSEAPELYQETAIGWIPRDWALSRCIDLCSRICVGIVIQPTQYYVEAGIPALRSANVREEGIDPSNFVYITASSNQQLAKSQLKAGDIVSVRTGYPGTSAVVPDELEGANCIDILISTPSEKVSSDFLCDWINSSFGKEQVLRQQGGMAQQHFNVGEMRELLVALPTLAEQNRIREKLSVITQKLMIERARAEKYRSQKLGLMQDLLTGKVPVKVDGQTSATSDQALEQKVLSRLGERAQAMEVDIDAI
jgi:type I restriction enzyme, S subunit